ncbi:hypothetical protein M8C21_031746, partial [Ambrosia artemisiifolia]
SVVNCAIIKGLTRFRCVSAVHKLGVDNGCYDLRNNARKICAQLKTTTNTTDRTKYGVIWAKPRIRRSITST